MALAVLGSRNELYPTDAMPYMRNPLAEFSNPNPNPRQARAAAPAARAKSGASEDEVFGGVDYVVYSLGSYSRDERRELRRRLSTELERVRSLSSRIDSAAAGSGRLVAGVGSLDSPNARTPASRGSKASLPPPAAGSNGKKAVPATAEMKRCGQILNRLRQHKDAWIFLDPVDAEKWSLHDYHQIIHHPMDLGTVKRKLDAGEYASPENFAADVRLTFTNALTYNPQGHDVYKWAALLLASFDKSFNTQFHGAAAGNPATTTTPAGVGAKGKLPKPKAKAPHKREMSFEEKQQLGEELTSLPPEKAEQLLQILNRRNKSDASQHLGNEVELDIEMLDTETLWELDRFVSNCKKSMSKLKRLLPENPGRIAPAIPPPPPMVAEEDDEVQLAKKARKDGDLVEEEIDILGDDGPAAVFPPVVIEKDAKSDRSSSSGSGSSSSSGSRSGSSSSSSSGSDSDEAESPFPGRTSPGGS